VPSLIDIADETTDLLKGVTATAECPEAYRQVSKMTKFNLQQLSSVREESPLESDRVFGSERQKGAGLDMTGADPCLEMINAKSIAER